MKRGLWCCPSKCRHFILVDYAKTEFFGGHVEASSSILHRSIILFPEEWRMALERVNQLVVAARESDA